MHGRQLDELCSFLETRQLYFYYVFITICGKYERRYNYDM